MTFHHIFRHFVSDNIKEDDSRGEYHSRTNWAPYDTKFDSAGVARFACIAAQEFVDNCLTLLPKYVIYQYDCLVVQQPIFPRTLDIHVCT